MKDQMMKKKNKGLIFLGVVIVITILSAVFVPEKSTIMFKTSAAYLKQMIIIFPSVLILMGLFSVWVSKEFVMQHLGKSSGLKGIVLAFILGAIPTGPIFIAFPMAQALRKKGASYTNIVIFLSAWACIKIPQELIEIQFMGVKFMLARLGMTIVFITIMGIFIDKMMTIRDVESNR